MDPLSIVATVSSLLFTCVKITKAASDIYSRYSNAVPTMSSIVTETLIVKTALSRIQSLASDDASALSERMQCQAEVSQSLERALMTCTAILSQLDEEIEWVLGRGNAARRLGKMMRARQVWNEETMNGLLQQLRGLELTLTLLITVLHSEISFEMHKLLQQIKASLPAPSIPTSPASKVQKNPTEARNFSQQESSLSTLAVPNLILTNEEKEVYGRLFREADRDELGIITGETAVRFFEGSGLAPQVMGQIWHIVDTQNRGFLTQPEFAKVLRLVGYCQAGQAPSEELTNKPGPLAELNPNTIPSMTPVIPLSGPLLDLEEPWIGEPVGVPPLTQDEFQNYSAVWHRAAAKNGLLPARQATQILDNPQLPPKVLGQVWALVDRINRGSLVKVEFVVAMHLVSSYRAGLMRVLPSAIPEGLWEAAAR